MNIKSTSDGHLAILSKPLDSRPKLLDLAYGAVFLFWAFFFLGEALNIGVAAVVVWGLVAATICFIGAYRFLNKAAISEQLLIGDGELRLIKKSILTRVQVFAIAEISQFRHLERTPSTKHPLGMESFDALGFQTVQELTKDLAGDKRMAFDYDGRVIAFGENIYSWEFQEIAGLVLAAGGDVVNIPPATEDIAGFEMERPLLPGERKPMVWEAPLPESSPEEDGSNYVMPPFSPEPPAADERI
jgi:hypothetical protein